MAKIKHIMTLDDQILAGSAELNDNLSFLKECSDNFFYLESCYKPDGLFKKKINIEILGHKFKNYWVLIDKVRYEDSNIRDVIIYDISNIYEDIDRNCALQKAKERLDTLLDILMHEGKSSLVRFIYNEYDERKNITI